MVEVDFKKCRLAPYAHQMQGVRRLIAKPRYGLFWEMRLGKSKAIEDAASFLWQAGELDAVLIVAPAQVKDVWAHKELGEIRKHCFAPWVHYDINSGTAEYIDILIQAAGKDVLTHVTISHELLRQEDAHSDFPRAKYLANALAGKKVWIVVDEGASFANWKSLQTKSLLRLMELVRPVRRTILDGTPIGNSPMEQFSKFSLLGKDVLGYSSFYHFRAVHAVLGEEKFMMYSPKLGRRVEKKIKHVVSFKNQNIINDKVKGMCEYLEQKDCLDMPDKVSMRLPVRLGQKAWIRYKDMRDDMVAQLDDRTMSAQHASVKVLRLAQLCAGFAGGVENPLTQNVETIEVSHEATQALVEWLKLRMAEDMGFRCVVWCRWRPEIERLYKILISTAEHTKVGISYGAKKEYDGELHPDHPFDGPYILLAQPQSLKYGVNLSKASVEVFLSKDYDRVTRAQAVERLQAPNGRRTTLVVDVVVCGPDGQRTITWDIDEALERKEDVAKRTTAEWKLALQ